MFAIARFLAIPMIIFDKSDNKHVHPAYMNNSETIHLKCVLDNGF